MNKRQTEVEKAKLAAEKKVLDNLQQQYNKALKAINNNVKDLQNDIKNLTLLLQEAVDTGDTEQVNIIKSRIQSKVYRKDYQEALKKQINGIVGNMEKSQYKSIQDYLAGCYDTGYIGTLYDITGQGVPMIIPIDQKAVVEAIKLDSKVSEKLYGGYTTQLKKKIQTEISRGISTGLKYSDIARNLKNQTKITRNQTMRIVRTEGHRIQQVSADDARHKAKDAGADVVKQWNAALDNRTRTSHAKIDGEIRELDEPFSNGLMFPGDPSGSAAEVINCRCAALQRAKWALNAEETKYLGKAENMTDEQLEPLARKLNIDVDELRKYSGQIIPIRAKNYDDFRRQYEKIWNYEPVKRHSVKYL